MDQVHKVILESLLAMSDTMLSQSFCEEVIEDMHLLWKIKFKK